MLITGANIVTQDDVVDAPLVVDGELIAEIGGSSQQAALTEDWHGDYLIPGFIDLHTDNIEKHLEPRRGVDWPAINAAQIHDGQMIMAGLTTVFDSLSVGDTWRNPNRAKMLPLAIDGIAAAQEAGLLKAEHVFHLRCEVTDPEMMDLLRAHISHPLVKLLSITDHAPGKRQCKNLDAYHKDIIAHTGRTAEETTRLVAEIIKRSEDTGVANYVAVAMLARQQGVAAASHDDETIEHVDLAADEGLGISEFPTTKEAAQHAHTRGMMTLMGAPNIVRGKSSGGNVRAIDLLEDGLLDGLVSDYVPSSILLAVTKLWQTGVLSLPEAVKLGATNPAQMAKLTDRGCIEVGKRADFLRVAFHDGGQAHIKAVYRQGNRVA